MRAEMAGVLQCVRRIHRVEKVERTDWAAALRCL